MIEATMVWLVELLQALVGVGGVHYLDAPLNAPMPYAAYHVATGTPDAELGSFGSDDRAFTISVQVADRDAILAIRLAAAIDALLRDSRPPTGDDWTLAEPVKWTGIVPNPGDRLEDRSMVFYAGNTYSVRVARTRSAVTGG